MSTQEVGKYRQFFDVDEKYFPCIDDSAIEAGAPWENTYPHETFIELLKNVENMLGGSTKRSVWIHGAYGTGKSQCAHALKKILEVPEEELKAYWNQYEPLKNNADLLNKIIGHKERGIVTAYRYASGGITTPRDLYFAIQESVKKALESSPCVSYMGENTLKESVLAWIKEHKEIFDILLKKPEWVATFSQSTSDEVINTLEKSSDVKNLMDNIFKMADKEGITAMSLDGDKLKNWLKDVIKKNDIKIVLVWDEFSGFFKQNRNSLDEFQKIVALCQEAPFYFIVVTHQTESIINSEDSTWKVVQQRFHFSEISLPDNIAFNLIGHAFNIKPAALDMWNLCADDLNNRLSTSRAAVMKAARISDPTSGVMARAEKSVLSSVWDVNEYWADSETSGLEISVIKRDLEEIISEGFKRDGQISIDDIYSHLEVEYGFAPCNLSAFIVGFLLKEYGGEPFRYLDSSGSHDSMSAEKLSEMIGNYISGKSQPTYIVKMTPEEMAFYEVTEKAWGLESDSCAHISQAQVGVKNKMQSLRLPVWSLKEVDNTGVYDFVEKYIELIQKEGKDAHKIALSIGSAALIKTSLGDNLAELLTIEKCQEGMKSFLQEFENGLLLKLAAEIGAEDNMLSDISHLFSVAYSSLWKSDMGENEIKKLIVDYTFVKETNRLLNCSSHSKAEAFDKWREKLEFVMCSHEALEEYFSSMKEVYVFLFDIVARKDILPDQMKKCTLSLEEQSTNLQSYFDNEISTFHEIYKAYLDDISVEECAQLKVPQLINVFRKSKTESNVIVKGLADEFRKNQTKTKMFSLWREKTGSKTPREWSAIHRTPILCLIPKNLYDDAKKAFEVLNRTTATEKEIESTLAFLEGADFYADLTEPEKVDQAFAKMLGRYKTILTDIEKVRDALERLSVEPYEWDTHPSIRSKILELAKAEYDAGGSDTVVSKIEKMSSEDLKKHLIKLIKDNINIGVEIMNEGE